MVPIGGGPGSPNWKGQFTGGALAMRPFVEILRPLVLLVMLCSCFVQLLWQCVAYSVQVCRQEITLFTHDSSL